MADGTDAANTPLDPIDARANADVIDAHANAVKVVVTRMVLQNERLRRRENELERQLDDALDRIFELQKRCRAKDEVILELQERAIAQGVR